MTELLQLLTAPLKRNIHNCSAETGPKRQRGVESRLSPPLSLRGVSGATVRHRFTAGAEKVPYRINIKSAGTTPGPSPGPGPSLAFNHGLTEAVLCRIKSSAETCWIVEDGLEQIPNTTDERHHNVAVGEYMSRIMNLTRGKSARSTDPVNCGI